MTVKAYQPGYQALVALHDAFRIRALQRLSPDYR